MTSGTHGTSVTGGLATMHPAYFALVMATGIVSIACQLLQLRPVAVALLVLNVAFFGVLWLLTILRIVRFPDRVVADGADHGRAVGFFTIVAATCVLGSQAWMIASAWRVAACLWITGIVLWGGITYTVFGALIVKPEKPSLAAGINGGWLTAVVAAQSVSALGSQLAEGFGAPAPQVLLFSLVMWLGGGMLYIWIIALIFYRYMFFALSPSELSPPYWINMGAVAISTLAGSLLVLASAHSPLVGELLPFIKGLTIMFWATASWWLPMLVILGVWRHVYHRFPLRYDPLYWGAVFPLGMYTVCTFRLAQVIDAPFLLVVPRLLVYVSLSAWALTLIGLVRQLVSAARSGVAASAAIT